ncbi:MAG: hypothetical protein JJU36_17385 [Phycisphaeraceae bacterium]|nr:hypothetical protein [Phycisphaeraceae bacterium]
MNRADPHHRSLPPSAARLLERLGRAAPSHVGPIRLAAAPGRLDVMGGIADYMGCRVCQWPLDIRAAACAWQTGTNSIELHSAQQDRPFEIPMDALRADDPRSLARRVPDDQSWARYPLGCAWWMIRQSESLKGHGMALWLDSDVPQGAGVSSSAAIEISALGALADLLSVRLTPLELAQAGQEVENRVVGAPCGIMDQVASCMGLAEHLVVLLCRPSVIESWLPMPAGYAVQGIHSGVHHAVSGNPYIRSRTAAYMGLAIINAARADDREYQYLTEIEPDHFARDLEPLLPELMTGRAFIDQYGGTRDAVTTVQPDREYPIRNAARHHVHEMARVTRFVELLGSGPGELDGAMLEAGRLMNQSHQSYGENAGLGHEATDLLAQLLTSGGPESDVLGARITGGGNGGTVAVLHRDTPRAEAHIDEAARAYTARAGLQTRRFEGGGDGLARQGVWRLERWDAPAQPCEPPLSADQTQPTRSRP